VTTALRQWSRFGKFNLVGLLGAALQLLLLLAFTKSFGLSAVIATPLVVELVILHNFAWHERFTWRDRKVKSTRRRLIMLARFHAGNGLISLFGNTTLMYLFVQRLKAPTLPSAIASIAICSLFNFLVADQWVYARRSRAS
jgi:putative flippase GtrA